MYIGNIRAYSTWCVPKVPLKFVRVHLTLRKIQNFQHHTDCVVCSAVLLICIIISVVGPILKVCSTTLHKHHKHCISIPL